MAGRRCPLVGRNSGADEQSGRVVGYFESLARNKVLNPKYSEFGSSPQEKAAQPKIASDLAYFGWLRRAGARATFAGSWPRLDPADPPEVDFDYDAVGRWTPITVSAL